MVGNRYFLHAGMADDEAKAQSIGISNKEEDFKNPNPFVSIFQNLLHIFPPLKPKTNHASPPSPQQVSAEETETYKPEVVTFPDTRQTIPPLKLEAEELEKNSNPAILWQVYALGGFIVLRWVWARWKERRTPKNGPSDEGEPSPADD